MAKIADEDYNLHVVDHNPGISENNHVSHTAFEEESSDVDEAHYQEMQDSEIARHRHSPESEANGLHRVGTLDEDSTEAG